jgi:hypothetical protein
LPLLPLLASASPSAVVLASFEQAASKANATTAILVMFVPAPWSSRVRERRKIIELDGKIALAFCAHSPVFCAHAEDRRLMRPSSMN